MAITATEALSPSTLGEIDDATEIVAASIREFDTETATELRSSKLIELLKSTRTLLSTPNN